MHEKFSKWVFFQNNILVNHGKSCSILLNLAKPRSWSFLKYPAKTILFNVASTCKMLLLDLAKTTVLQELVLG
jgi:hypothetical protein